MDKSRQAFPSYHSVPETSDDEETSLLAVKAAADDPEEESSASSTPIFRRRRRHRRPLPKSYAVLAGLAVLLLVTLPFLPTQEEMELAQAYGLSWTSTHRLRSAQLLADSNILVAHQKSFVHDIQKHGKHGSREEYLEPPEGCEATVTIVRHCEKRNIREHCAYIGYERSVYLATLFGDDQERWPAPDYVFAEGPGSRHNRKKLNFREIETVGPLAEKAGVEIDDSYFSSNVNHMARKILTFIETGQMCGKSAVIAWKHSDIGHIARHLGCGPKQGCPMDYHGRSFDEVWQIKYVYEKFHHSSRKNLELPHRPEWRIFGSVQQEGFDPLSFSKKVGDYPKGGTSSGARWRASMVNIPERKRPTDNKSWEHAVPGLLGLSEVSTMGDDAHGK